MQINCSNKLATMEAFNARKRESALILKELPHKGERERGGAEFSQREKRALLAEFWQPLNFLLVYRFSTFKTKKMQRRVFTCHSCCQCHTSAAAVAWQMRCDKAKSVWPLPKTKTSCHTQPIPHAIPPAISHPCSVLGSKCCHISESATN